MIPLNGHIIINLGFELSDCSPIEAGVLLYTLCHADAPISKHTLLLMTMPSFLPMTIRIELQLTCNRNLIKSLNGTSVGILKLTNQNAVMSYLHLVWDDAPLSVSMASLFISPTELDTSVSTQTLYWHGTHLQTKRHELNKLYV